MSINLGVQVFMDGGMQNGTGPTGIVTTVVNGAGVALESDIIGHAEHMGPSLLYVEFIQFPQWTGNPRPPGLRTFSIIPLKIRLFGQQIWFFELNVFLS